MMNDFKFDLQRFNKSDETITATESKVISLNGGATLSVGAGTKDLVVKYSSDDKYAIVSLSSTSDGYFRVNGKEYGLTGVSSTQTNGEGVVFSLGSSSAIVGGIDSGDIFYVGDEKFSMTTSGLFAGTNNADKVNLDATISSVTLNNTSVPADLSSNWNKIMAVNDNKLSIADTLDFDATGYKGILASNTDISHFTKYASLKAGDIYFISSVAGASSLSHISLASGLMSEVADTGIIIDDAFAGTVTTLPYIEVGNTTVKVNNASGDFFVSGGYGSKLSSIDANAAEVSLISGSLVTSNQAQSISAGNYKITGYNDTLSTNYDGIRIGTDINGNVTWHRPWRRTSGRVARSRLRPASRFRLRRELHNDCSRLD